MTVERFEIDANDPLRVDLAGVTLDKSDAKAFLEEKVPSSPCELCENHKFDIIFGPGDGDYMVIGASGTGKSVRHFPVFAACCTNCGHLRIHSLTLLADYKKGKVLAAAQNAQAPEA